MTPLYPDGEYALPRFRRRPDEHRAERYTATPARAARGTPIISVLSSKGSLLFLGSDSRVLIPDSATSVDTRWTKTMAHRQVPMGKRFWLGQDLNLRTSGYRTIPPTATGVVPHLFCRLEDCVKREVHSRHRGPRIPGLDKDLSEFHETSTAWRLDPHIGVRRDSFPFRGTAGPAAFTATSCRAELGSFRNDLPGRCCRPARAELPIAPPGSSSCREAADSFSAGTSCPPCRTRIATRCLRDSDVVDADEYQHDV